MQLTDWLQVLLYVTALAVATPLLGRYMAAVFQGERHGLSRAFGGFERFLYRIGGVNPDTEQTWRQYCVHLLVFNALGLAAVFALQLFQATLPLNPQALPAPSWHLALNTAVSFVTNTNWQSYAGEVTLSYAVQMLGLTVQNFLSAATGMAVLIGLIRGFTRSGARTIGNFWTDMTRGTLYVLLPLSILLAVALVGEGVVQNTSAYVTAQTLSGTEQVLPMGPAASQIAIKQLGTNGGGFFNVNSAHPFENPTPWSNWLQLFSILLIPSALAFTYGQMVGSRRHGWLIWTVMLVIWLGGLGLSLYSEFQPNHALGVTQMLEGKETRFGITNSVLWSTATTAASNGSVNAMHGSLSPLSGAVALFNMMLGEIIFGGVGCGMYGMVMFILLTVFLSGLMVGRTPEYLGKKIDIPEVAMVLVTILAPSAAILIGSAIAVVIPAGLSSLANTGPHGLTEILYAFTSAGQNNGSAFAGLNANVPFYNVALSLCMLVGRFAVLIPTLAIAGSMARKTITPASSGTFSTDHPIFLVLLIAVILIVGALTHLPALALGPIVEHLLLQQGVVL